MMDKFLKTKEGLEYLLETFPSDMPVIDAIDKVEKDFKGNFRN